MKLKKSERIAAKIAKLRGDIALLEEQFKSTLVEEKALQEATIENSGYAALRGWNSHYMRETAEALRDLARSVTATDESRARRLYNLNLDLKARAEKLERAALEKVIRREAYYAILAGKDYNEEAEFERRWDEHLAAFRSDPD